MKGIEWDLSKTRSFLFAKGCLDVTENRYQAKLIKTLERRFPGCLVLKNDPSYRQGMLDLTILYGDNWATLEVKASAASPVQPNQDHYVERLNEMFFAAYIYPENEEEVLSALQQAFESPGRACVPQS
jgi:hypothetical protein